jgi:ferredoxin
MAKIICDDEMVELPDNSSAMPYAEQLGVYFGCQDGNCGVCDVEIVAGAENLNSLTDKEKDFNLLKNHRLLCQCKIKKGEIKIKL